MTTNSADTSVLDSVLPAHTALVLHAARTLAKLDGQIWADLDEGERESLIRQARSFLQIERQFVLNGHRDSRGEAYESAIWIGAPHKSASMFIYKFGHFVLKNLPDYWRLYSGNNRPPNLDEALTATGPHILLNRHISLLRQQYPFRPRMIFHIRDPRDILVSEYYSLGYIHSDSGFNQLAHDLRSKIQAGNMGIDEYVLFSAENGIGFFGDKPLRKRLVEDLAASIRKCEERSQDFIVVRYEDLVNDFPVWAGSVLRFMNLDSLIEPAVREFADEFVPSKDTDKLSHKRQIAPGDHKSKLAPETIEKLNEIFAPILHKYYAS